jgi:hypothetical protein
MSGPWHPCRNFLDPFVSQLEDWLQGQFKSVDLDSCAAAVSSLDVTLSRLSSGPRTSYKTFIRWLEFNQPSDLSRSFEGKVNDLLSQARNWQARSRRLSGPDRPDPSDETDHRTQMGEPLRGDFDDLTAAVEDVVEYARQLSGMLKSKIDQSPKTSSGRTNPLVEAIDKLLGFIKTHTIDGYGRLKEKNWRRFGTLYRDVQHRADLSGRSAPPMPGRKLQPDDEDEDDPPAVGEIHVGPLWMQQMNHLRAVAVTNPEIEPLPPGTEPVVLNGLDQPPIVRGKSKRRLTKAQYDVVEVLVEAGRDGLSKFHLDSKSCHTDARKILKRLAASDADWKKVIEFPKTARSGGYRIRHSAR